jgi:purine-binding chemotaxis protein CheW
MKAEDQKARAGEAVVEPNVHLIVFKIGTEEFGIRIEQVKEVTVTPEIARMPRTPSFIKGVANIRGDIIAIMDLETRFGIPPASVPLKESKQTYTLVIETDNYTIGVMVKEVPQSLTVSVSQIDRTPGMIHAINVSENFIDGIAKEDGRLIIIIDMQKILKAEEIEMLPA